MFIVMAAVLQILLASAALAANFSGLIVSVLDGYAKKGLWADPQPVPPGEWRKWDS